MVLVEGPSGGEELQMFFDADVEGTWQTVPQPSKGRTQNIGLAVRTDLGRFKDPSLQQFDTNEMEAFGVFLADTDDDGIEENYKFERRPVYAEIVPAVGHPFRILGLHVKSKGIFTAYEWSKWWSMADGNRRKLLAQVSQIRQRFLDAYLAAPAAERVPLIVCGDISDGPGLDSSEKRLFGSAVERLMGNVWHPELCLRGSGNMVSDRSESSHNTLWGKRRFKAMVIERLLHIVVLRQQDAICSSLREFSATRQLLPSVLRKCAQLSSLTMLPLPQFLHKR